MKNIAKNHFEEIKALNNFIVCGIDEVGRGCLAGPLVTAAALLKSTDKNAIIKDSKLLSETQREKAYNWLIKNSIFSISILDHAEIDRHNVYKATQLSMCRAYYQLCAITPVPPTVVLVDAVKLPLLSCEVISLIKGERESISIAAASIIAKVTRDRLMKRLSTQFPLWGLAAHKGYGTSAHYDDLHRHGISPIHRNTFLKNYTKQSGPDKDTQRELFSI